MQLSKSYKLLRFLNRRHSAISRYSLATLGWLGTLACTREPVLASALAAEFKSNNYELACRKAARYARRFSQRFSVINDPFFNFTQNTTPIERDALLRSLQRDKNKLPQADYLTDQLYILAANIHYRLEQEQQPNADIARFYALADQALTLANDNVGQVTSVAQKIEQKPNFSRRQATEALRDLAKVLPLSEWPWFVISGTFLGLHREGEFLAHDYDIDTGIHAEHVDLQRLVGTLKTSNVFDIKKLDHHVQVTRCGSTRQLHKRLSMIKLVHRNGMQVDVFPHYTENGKCWHGSIIHRWENTPFKLVQRQLEGVTVLAPDNPDQYLTENYGNWRTPVKNYDCSTGTPNLVPGLNFMAFAMFTKRLIYFMATDKPRANSLIAARQAAGLIEFQGTAVKLVQAL